MLAPQVVLDFACCGCGRPVGLTLSCTGPGLKAIQPTATVCIACPNCQAGLRIAFSTDGTVQEIRRELSLQRWTQPCYN